MPPRTPSMLVCLPLGVALTMMSACETVAPTPVEPSLTLPDAIETEISVAARAPATVDNLDPELELVVSDIRFEPDDEAVLRWFSIEGQSFIVPPGGSVSFDVWFRPAEEGAYDATLFVDTSGGTVSGALSLSGVPSPDVDEDGYSVADGDCDDTEPTVYPDAPELCDGLDNDCDTNVDGEFDSDRDGFVDEDRCPIELAPLDCNDSDATTFPGNTEECDGSDSDCNGIVDDINQPADLQDGVCEGALKRCSAGGPLEPDYSAIAGYETLEFSCDGIDNDCDGVVDGFDRLGDGTSDCIDDDGDGEREVDGDCDDQNPGKTSVDCGPQTMVITRNDDGFATIDLNTLAVKNHSLGVRTYHGVGLSKDEMWFSSRDDRRIIRYDLRSGTPLISSVFERSPWAVEIDDASGDLLVLYGDGSLQRRNPANGSYKSEVELTGATTAWTKAPDGTFWICTGGDGELVHADVSGVLGVADITTACYGPPVLTSTSVIVPGFDDFAIIEVDQTTLEEVRARVTDAQPIRGAWIKSDLWVTTSVSDTFEIFNGGDLLRIESHELDGQTQGIWYDEGRDVVWIAVYGADEVVAVDRRTRAVLAEIPVNDPIYLFPLPQR